MSSLGEELADYTYQALPDLGTGSRNPPQGVHTLSTQTSVEIPEDVGLSHEQILRAAFAKLILLYLDTRDFLFADASSTTYLPYRVKVDATKMFREFVEELSCMARSADAVSLDALRDALSLPESYTPLPILFVWGQKDIPAELRGNICLEARLENDRELHLQIHCDSTIMSLDTVKILLDQIVATFSSICIHVDNLCTMPLDLPRDILSACETPYNESEAELTPTWLMHNASSRPNAIAHEIYSSVSLAPTVLTYASLNEQSNRLAHWLVNKGLEREDKVAVCRARDAHFYVAQAGIFKSGGCYVSIDPELPEERKRYIAEDSEAKFVFTTAEQAPFFGNRAVVLDDSSTQEELSMQDTKDICLAELDSLAYLLYTSGTTGTPKGCLLNHRGLYWAITAMCVFPSEVTNPDTDKRLALASIAFDVHISEICQSWRLGTRLVSGPRYELLANLQENIITMGITHLGMVPSMIEATLTSPDDLPLKYLVSGGEKISDGLLKKWATCPKLILANFYGPTEATVGCTSRQVKINDRKENIGRPFSSCQAYVVDPEMNIVPRGTPGELVVEGPLVGAGYHKLPEVTKKVFLEWPRPGCRCYRTGDLVRLMPDNTLEIMGRIDTQIKLRGVRIESEGVSNVLIKASPIPVDATTLVSGHPELGNTEVLVSFVAVSDPDITFLQRRSERSAASEAAFVQKAVLALQEMKDAAVRELAVYMRPSYIIPVNFLPLSINGKTDNKILAAMFKEIRVQELLRLQGRGDGSQSERTAREPSEEERSVIEVVARLIGTGADKLTPFSNLFESGLDSLKFTALASELRRTFKVHISVAELMSKPVIEDVTKLVSGRSDGVVEEASDSLEEFATKWRHLAESVFEPSQIQAVLPPFPVQEGVLFRCMESPQLYVQHFMYRCAPSVDLEKMKKSWESVVGRQEILRTVFISDAALLQVVLKDGVSELSWRISDCDLGERATFEDWFLCEKASHVAARINEDFTTPLFAIEVYRNQADNTAYFVFSINHALYDGNAMPLLIQEFRQHYLDQDLSEATPLAPILRSIPSQDNGEMKRFWTSQFENIDLQARVVRHPSPTSKAEFASHTFETSLSDLQTKANTLHVTLQALFSVVFAIAGQNAFDWTEDAIFGVIRAGRSLAIDRVDTAICPLVSVIPTVVDLDTDATFTSLSKRSQNFVNESTLYEQFPLGIVQRWLGVKDLVEVLLSCRFDSGNKSTEIIEHIGTSRSPPEFIFAVELVLHPDEDTIEARASFTNPEMNSTDVVALFGRFEDCLESLLSGQEEIGKDTTVDSFNASATTPIATTNDRSPLNIELELRLIELVAKFLHVDSSAIRPTTSLTSLGLSSIKAVALARSLLENGIQLSAIDLIQADHIRAISQRLHAGSASEPNTTEIADWLATFKKRLTEDLNVEALKLTSNDEVTITGCTSLQTGMLAQTINSSGLLYVHAFTLRLVPECDIDKLQAAWHQAVKQLDILRTSFHFTPNLGQWAQVAHCVADFKWSRESRNELGSAATDFISSLSLKDEDSLARPPVYFRHVSADKDYLIVVLHHALYDGISIPKLLQHVRRLYEAQSVDVSTPFHKVADAILAQETYGTSYWSQRLNSVKPWFFLRTSRSSGSAWRSSSVIDVSAAEIRRFCRRYHVHPQCLGQAIWAKVLCTKAVSPDVVFGQVVSGRSLADADNVIGPVFNTIPCRVSLFDGQTNKQLVRAIQRWNNDGISWQHASLRAIQRELKVGSLFDTLFLFQPQVTSSNEIPLWHIASRDDMQESKTQYAVNIELHEGETSYSVFASCAADVMTQSELAILLSQFNRLFVELVRSPNALVMPERCEIFSSASDSHEPPPAEANDVDYEAIMQKWSDRQRKLWNIVVDFTGVPQEAIRPNTFLIAIGIDSICAIQVAALARRAGISLAATDVARSPTVQDLLSIESIAKEPSATATAAVELPAEVVDSILALVAAERKRNIERLLPLAAGMEWTLSAWQANGTVFSFKLDRMNESSDAVSSRLREAWTGLIRRHEILRTSLVHTDEREYRLALCVLKEFEEPWIEISLSDEAEVEAVKKQSREFASIPIPIDQPPTRLALLHGKTASYVVIGLHHMQYDGWSLPLLIRDLETLYASRPASSGNRLSSFLSLFVRSPEILSEQEKYWRRVLSPEYCPHLFPFLNKNPESTSAFLLPSTVVRGISYLRRCLTRQDDSADSAASQTFVDVKLSDQVVSLDLLQRKAQSHRISAQSILLACWAVIQAKWSSAPAATFLLSHAGRSGDIPDLDNLAAPCCNYVPTSVRVQERDEKSSEGIIALAARIHHDLSIRTAAIEQSRVADISRWAGLEGAPLCNISVNVLRLPGKAQASGEKLTKDSEKEQGSGEKLTKDSEKEQGSSKLLQSLKFPYNPAPLHSFPGDPVFPEIQHDCQVEIYFSPSANSVGMSIECHGEMLSTEQARNVVDDWSRLVGNVLV